MSASVGTAESCTPESLGWQLRAALPPIRLQSVSLYDGEGEVLWLSEGALGPDEHAVVEEALEVLGTDASRTQHERALEDGRGAVFLAVRAPRGELVGLAMILADAKSLAGSATGRLVTPTVRLLLQRVAVMLKAHSTGIHRTPPEAAPAAETAPATGAEPTIDVSSESAVVEVSAPEPGIDATETSAGGEPLAPRAIDAMLTSADPAGADFERDLVLYVQQLVKLRSGGRTRRYEVLARSRTDASRSAVPAAIAAAMSDGPDGARTDGFIVEHLLGWLGRNREFWEGDPASFSINLSRGAVQDESFPQHVAVALRANGVPPGNIGFELSQALCVEHRQEVEGFIAACERLGCFVVLDDFTLDSAVIPLLRSRALRVLKIDPQLTVAAMKDKLAQALVIAISQASKVLGLHCVAKRIDSEPARQWLSAIGCDFAQGFVLESPQPLESLAAGPTAAAAGQH